MLRTRAEVRQLLTRQLGHLPECPGNQGAWAGRVRDGLGTVGVEVTVAVGKRDGEALLRTVSWQLTRDKQHWPALLLTFLVVERKAGLDLAATFGPQPEPEQHFVHAARASALIEQLVLATTPVGSGCATVAARQWSEQGQLALVLTAPEAFGASLSADLRRPRDAA